MATRYMKKIIKNSAEEDSREEIKTNNKKRLNSEK